MVLHNLPSKARRMCPCCCGAGKSDLPQWQKVQLINRKLTKTLSYGAFEWKCESTGKHWTDDDLEYRNSLSKQNAIELQLLENAAGDEE